MKIKRQIKLAKANSEGELKFEIPALTKQTEHDEDLSEYWPARCGLVGTGAP